MQSPYPAVVLAVLSRAHVARLLAGQLVVSLALRAPAPDGVHVPKSVQQVAAVPRRPVNILNIPEALVLELLVELPP